MSEPREDKIEIIRRVLNNNHPSTRLRLTNDLVYVLESYDLQTRKLERALEELKTLIEHAEARRFHDVCRVELQTLKEAKKALAEIEGMGE